VSDSTEKKPAVSFFSKQEVRCPVCGASILREDPLTGGGRMIAGELSDELRRDYEPSIKYGKIYPLIYSVGVCPKCCYAALWQDFNELDKGTYNKISASEESRMESVSAIFPGYQFKEPRRLLDGAAAYYLALLCYEKAPIEFSPTIRRGIICLRSAWLSNDMHIQYPGKNYDFVAREFYRKALFFYNEALLKETDGSEPIGGLKTFGPDIDKNYGFNGIIYLTGLLEYKYGQTKDPAMRLQKFAEHKRAIARIFGLGRSSKNKPGPLLEHSRKLYDTFTRELKEANTVDFGDDDDEE
jgi:uncharacterized protein (DUF2225 family)